MYKNIKVIISVFIIIATVLNINTVAAADISYYNNKENANENNKVLYIIEKDNYRKMLNTDTAIAINKDSLLSINSKSISQEDMNNIRSAKSLFVIGEIEDNKIKFEEFNNFQGQLFEEDKYDISIKNANKSVDKDLLVVNGESLADYVTANQIKDIENRNILLIDGQVDIKTEEFIRDNGKNKNILFVEGEFKISQEIKEQVMTIANNKKYEIEESHIVKNSIKPDVEYKTLFDSEKLDHSKRDVFKKVAELSSEITKKSHEENNDLLINKGKLITYDMNKQDEYVNNQNKSDDDNVVKFVDVVSNDESLIVLKSEGAEDKFAEDNYSLTLTYAQPIEIYSKTSETKKEFVPSKPITEEIIISIMEGDYGDGKARKDNLEYEGYNYEDVQKEIERILEERRLAYEEQLKKEREIKNRNNNSKMHMSPKPAQQVNKFINEALKMKGWIYSQPQRWDYGYADCSSIVIRALINSGITNNKTNLTTWTISDDPRFYEIPMSKIEPGDILWYVGHMEIYMGGDYTFGAFRPGKLSGYASNTKRFNRAFRISGQ